MKLEFYSTVIYFWLSDQWPITGIQWKDLNGLFRFGFFLLVANVDLIRYLSSVIVHCTNHRFIVFSFLSKFRDKWYRRYCGKVWRSCTWAWITNTSDEDGSQQIVTASSNGAGWKKSREQKKKTESDRGLRAAREVLRAAMLCRMLTTLITMTLMPSSWTSLLAVPQTDSVRRPVQLVSSRPLRRTYLGRGLTGRVECPAEDDPPHWLVIWTRRGRVIEYTGESSSERRLSVEYGGTLVIKDVQPSDEGDYRCTLYSPQDDVKRLSFVIRVKVRGQYKRHSFF